MTICGEEERLFNEWKRHRTPFVSDGAVSENDYQKSSPKIAFILKEVNSSNGNSWDLRKFLREGGIPKTWDTVARWTHGIKNLPSRYPWSFYEKIETECRQEAFKSIVVMNLKKTPGGSKAVPQVLKAVATEDAPYIKRQYALYDPDITIICGINLGDLFKEVVGHNENRMEWRQTSLTSIKRGRRQAWIRYYSRADNDKFNKYVVEFFHPQSRRNHEILLCDLLNAVEEIGLPCREH